jgi:hypothetical protein
VFEVLICHSFPQKHVDEELMDDEDMIGVWYSNYKLSILNLGFSGVRKGKKKKIYRVVTYNTHIKVYYKCDQKRFGICFKLV